jgi:hypothetical protein
MPCFCYPYLPVFIQIFPCYFASYNAKCLIMCSALYAFMLPALFTDVHIMQLKTIWKEEITLTARFYSFKQ